MIYIIIVLTLEIFTIIKSEDPEDLRVFSKRVSKTVRLLTGKVSTFLIPCLVKTPRVLN